MRALLLFLPTLLAGGGAFWAGRVTSRQRPVDNHRELARYVDALLERDALVPVLTAEQKREGEALVDGFHRSRPARELGA